MVWCPDVLALVASAALPVCLLGRELGLLVLGLLGLVHAVQVRDGRRHPGRCQEQREAERVVQQRVK